MQSIRAIDGALGVIQLYSSHLIASLPEIQRSAAERICWAESFFQAGLHHLAEGLHQPLPGTTGCLGPAGGPLLYLFPEWKRPSPGRDWPERDVLSWIISRVIQGLALTVPGIKPHG